MRKPGISPQAQAFLDSYVQSSAPTDFSRIVELREEIRAAFSAGAERAISRYDLIREDIEIAGVPCERIVSRSGQTSKGTLVYLFGGGFIVGCPYSDLPVIGALAYWCGLEVIAPKYRLAPEYPAPCAADDCFSVWRHISADCSGPLLLAGESAGGNLAVVVAQRAITEGIALPCAMALLSPAVDLRTDPLLYEPTTHADPTLSLDHIGEVLQVYGNGIDPGNAELSPLFGDFKGMPPTIITTGTRDLLLSMCLRFYRQLVRAGVDVECRVWDGLWHVFEYYDDYPEAAESLKEISEFLNVKASLKSGPGE